MYYYNGTSYYKIKDIANYIGIKKSVIDGIVKKAKNDLILSNYMMRFKAETNGGVQESYFIVSKMLYLLLCKITITGFNKAQIEKYKQLLNYVSDFEHYIGCDNRKIYSYESNFRDDLYDIGFIDNIKIIDKEVTYDFGRIDLLGIDVNNNRCCIELKKYTAYEYLDEQLIRYKCSNCFDRVIYIGYS